MANEQDFLKPIADMQNSLPMLLGILGVCLIVGIVVARQKGIGPFKKWDKKAIVLSGTPPMCDMLITKGRVADDAKRGKYIELQSPPGATAEIPPYDQWLTLSTWIFYAPDRDTLIPLRLHSTTGEVRDAYLEPILTPSVKLAYRNNIKMIIERTTLTSALMQYWPIIAIASGIVVIFIVSYFISGMATAASAASASAAASSAEAAKAAASCVNGPVPP